MRKPYLTPDIWHAAILSFNGYTLLGAISHEPRLFDDKGREKLQFALIHPDEEKHDTMDADINRILTEFISDNGGHRQFARMYQMCQRALKNPIFKGDLR